MKGFSNIFIKPICFGARLSEVNISLDNVVDLQFLPFKTVALYPDYWFGVRGFVVI